MSNWSVEELRVLIVDDDLESVAMFEDLLAALGVDSVTSASTGWEAIALIGSERVDLLICERNLPAMGGLDLTRYLQSEPTSPSPAVPILMISRFCDRDVLLEARDAGISEFLLKPPSMENLIKHINVALNVPREFVRSNAYVGPSRRRGRRTAYFGDERRARRERDAAPSSTGEPAATKREPWDPPRVDLDKVEIVKPEEPSTN